MNSIPCSVFIVDLFSYFSVGQLFKSISSTSFANAITNFFVNGYETESSEFSLCSAINTFKTDISIILGSHLNHRLSFDGACPELVEGLRTSFEISQYHILSSLVKRYCIPWLG